jgi:RNA polymerase sigma factor (sigma-70 family)
VGSWQEVVPVADPVEARLEVFRAERPHLLAVAFRILGSDADAQDAVQETWIRFGRADIEHVRNLPAWLTTVVTRLCLDVLRRSREQPLEPAQLPKTPTRGEPDPEESALLASELTTAFTVVLEELTPPQRVALILHDVFGMPFDEVAHVLGTTPGSAKKLASRARGRVRRHEPVTPVGEPAEARRVVGAFLRAAQQGDLDALVRLLDPGVTRTADPQALPAGAPQLVRGASAVVAETQALRANAQLAAPATIDGRPGIVVRTDHGVRTALVFEVRAGRIVHYDVISDPQRLRRLTIEEPTR